ncbi:Tn3 family transposase [Microbacteriaceae bacterium 4G12]
MSRKDYFYLRNISQTNQLEVYKKVKTKVSLQTPFLNLYSLERKERAPQNQLQGASILNIIINAISVWNTAYEEKAGEELKRDGEFLI